MQVQGLYIELTLKTYRAVFGDLRHEHDLILLADRCVDDGICLTDSDRLEIIEKVNRPYFNHEGWKAKFVCRYPSESQSLIAWNLPTHPKIEDMVERIIEQATKLFANATA